MIQGCQKLGGVIKSRSRGCTLAILGAATCMQGQYAFKSRSFKEDKRANRWLHGISATNIEASTGTVSQIAGKAPPATKPWQSPAFSGLVHGMTHPGVHAGVYSCMCAVAKSSKARHRSTPCLSDGGNGYRADWPSTTSQTARLRG